MRASLRCLRSAGWAALLASASCVCQPAAGTLEPEDAGVDAGQSLDAGEHSTDGGDAGRCHQNGEPFAWPPEVRDPWHLYRDGRIREFCCQASAARIVLAEQPRGGRCEAIAPPQLTCVPEPTDDQCERGEDFCTSATDCFPPDGGYPLCCGVGDACQGLGPGHSRTGASGCCAGLEMIPFGLWSHTLGGCIQVPFPDFGICVEKCGDGRCTLGENHCNCAADCTP